MTRHNFLSILVLLSAIIPVFADDPVRDIEGEWPSTCGCWVWRAPQAEGARTVFFTFEEQSESGRILPRAVLGLVSGDQKLELVEGADNWWIELPATVRYRGDVAAVTVSLETVPPSPEELALMDEIGWDGDCAAPVTGTLEGVLDQDRFVVRVEGSCGC